MASLQPIHEDPNEMGEAKKQLDSKVEESNPEPAPSTMESGMNIVKQIGKAVLPKPLSKMMFTHVAEKLEKLDRVGEKKPKKKDWSEGKKEWVKVLLSD